MTVFGQKDVERYTSIYDMETGDLINQVTEIDTEEMTLTRHEWPLRIVGDKFASVTMKYRMIYPIYGGYSRPCLFICSGQIK